MPAFGHCLPCASGRSGHCDRRQTMFTGLQISDRTSRHHARGTDLRSRCCTGTFARHSVVHQDSCS